MQAGRGCREEENSCKEVVAASPAWRRGREDARRCPSSTSFAIARPRSPLAHRRRVGQRGDIYDRQRGEAAAARGTNRVGECAPRLLLHPALRSQHRGAVVVQCVR